jgi:hypothetical protein
MGYLLGSTLMIGAAIVEWCWGVAAERKSLESVARYGLAARCKPKMIDLKKKMIDLNEVGFALLYPAYWMEPLSSWPSWRSARVRSHSRLGLEGQMGHLITNALARPFLRLLFPIRRPRRARSGCA